MRPLTALVTGASSGLGREITRILEGYALIICVGRDTTRLEQVGREVEERSKVPSLVYADVRDEQALARALGDEFDTHDTYVDLLVHCAGVLKIGDSDEALEECVATNVKGMANAQDIVAPRLVRGGRVLVVSSAAALVQTEGLEAYGHSKRLQARLAESWRQDLAGRGISLTVAYPSIINTPMVTGIRPWLRPAVYRVFSWTPVKDAAVKILADTFTRRRESFLTNRDRLMALLARMAPRAFGQVLNAYVRLADPRRKEWR